MQENNYQTYPDYTLSGTDSQKAREKGLIDANWYQCYVPKDKMLKLLERKNGPAIRDTIIWFSLLIGSGISGFILWGTWWALIPFFIYGIAYGTACDSRWHETNHGTAFKSDWMNRVIYEISSFMVVRESVLWRWTHIRHHSDTLITGSDPEIAAQRPPKFWIFIFNLFNLRVWWIYIKSVSTHFVGKVTEDDKNLIPETEFKKLFLGARLIVLIYVSVIALSIYLDSILPLLYIGLPSIYGAWLMPVFSLTQHSGLPENVLDHRLNCRTIYMNSVNRFFYWNMNYHLEHHMFPLVPYHALPELHKIVRNECPKPYKGLSDAWREIIQAWIKQKKDPSYFVKLALPSSENKSIQKRTDHVRIDSNPVKDDWIQICNENDIRSSDIKRFDYKNHSYVIYKSDEGSFYASDGFCTHGNSHLSEGMLVGNVVECAKHNGRFNIKDGAPLRSPVCIGLNTYDVKEIESKLWLSLDSVKKVQKKVSNEKLKFKVVSNQNISTYVKELTLEPLNTNFNYLPGEYIQLQVPTFKQSFKDLLLEEVHAKIWKSRNQLSQFAENNETKVRNYSMASNPAKDKYLNFNVGIQFASEASVSAGVGSSYVFQLKPGDTVEASGPYGNFHLKSENKRDIVFIGGGTGMAPLRSQLSHLFETEKTKQIASFWYGARSQNDLLYADYFNELDSKKDNFSFHPVLSDPQPDEKSDLPRGFIHDVFEKEYLIKRSDYTDIDFYLCGPPAMIESCLALLHRFRITKEQIVYEEFSS